MNTRTVVGLACLLACAIVGGVLGWKAISDRLPRSRSNRSYGEIPADTNWSAIPQMEFTRIAPPKKRAPVNPDRPAPLPLDPLKSRAIAVRADVDDLVRILVTREGLELCQGLAGGVAVNGIEWPAETQPKLSNMGATQFLKDGIALEQVAVTVQRGAGTVELFQKPDRYEIVYTPPDVPVETIDLTVWLGPPLRQPSMALPRTPAFSPDELFDGDVLVTARIEGTDELKLYPDRAEWAHLKEAWPSAVRVNSVAWDPENAPQLFNRDATKYRDAPLENEDFQFEQPLGRGPVTAVWDDKCLTIRFHDPQPGADDYAVVIRTRPKLPEFTADEQVTKAFEEKLKGWQPRPHPKDPGLRTQKDVLQERLAWRTGRMRDAYRQHGRHSPDWDAAAEAFLDRAATRTDAPSDDLLDEGERVLARGCDDPLVCQVHAEHLYLRDLNLFLKDSSFVKERATRAKSLLKHACTAYESSQYPARVRWPAAAYLAAIYQAYRFELESKTTSKGPDTRHVKIQTATPAEQRAGPRLALRAIQDLTTLASEKLSPAERRAFYDELRSAIDYDREGHPLWEHLHRVALVLNRETGVHPWIRHLATEQSLSWTSRRVFEHVDRENPLDPDWEAYAEMLSRCRQHALAAWPLDPQSPVAAARMHHLTGLLAREDLSRQLRFWLDETLSIQMDDPEVHRNMLRLVSPHELGGTYENMLEIGIACLRTERFDTGVPDYFFEALRMIKADGGDPGDVLKTMKAEGDFRKALDGTEARVKDPQALWKLKSEHIVLAWSLDQRDEALRLFRELDYRPDRDALRGLPEGLGALYRQMLPPAVSPAGGRPLTAEPASRTHERPVFKLAVSPRGQWLAAMCLDGPVSIWDLKSGTLKTLPLSEGHSNHQLEFSRRFQSDVLRILHSYRNPKTPNAKDRFSCAISEADPGAKALGVLQEPVPLGKMTIFAFCSLEDGNLALASPDGNVVIWNSGRREIVARNDPEKLDIQSLAVSAGGLLATARGPVRLGKIPRLDGATGANPAPLLLDRSIDSLGDTKSIHMSSDGKRIGVRDGAGVWIIDADTLRPLQLFPGQREAFSADFRYLVTSELPDTPPLSAVVWDVATGKPLVQLIDGHRTSITSAAFSTDGSRVFTGDAAGEIREWQVPAGKSP